jgi:phosphoserine phosphatase RsbU/P
MIARFQRFWQRVTEGLEIDQLWSQFKRDAQSSYRLYSRDVKARKLSDTGRHRWVRTLQEFAWAILEKLTPARRVLLLIGIMFLIFPAGGFSFHGKAGQVEVVEFDFRFYAGVLLLLVLILEVSDRVVMKRDLEIAREIQTWLLPEHPPAIPGLAVAFTTRPANTVAGDYYDTLARPGDGNTRYLLAVADVAGKSIPAAMLMATFQASLRTLSATAVSLTEIVRGMNQYACTNSQKGARFTTAFLAEFDSATRQLDYINAGHNPPMLRRTTGTIEHLTEGGLPLGIMLERPYTAGRCELQAGDWLVIFTDGLVEALNYVGEEYGEGRMLTVLQYAVGVTPDEMLHRVMVDVDLFVADAPQHDDITLMLIKAI